MSSRAVLVAAAAAILALFISVPAAGASTGALQFNEAGKCRSASLQRGDDFSSPLLDLGFDINFGGAAYEQASISSNGAVVLGETFSGYIPTSGLNHWPFPAVVPFHNDIHPGRGAGAILWGTWHQGGVNYFCALWEAVQSYSPPIVGESGATNTFQALISQDASQAESGAFTATLNYESIGWDMSGNLGPSGVAWAGISDGSHYTWLIPRPQVAGAYMDTNTETGLVYHVTDGQPGRVVMHYDWDAVSSGQIASIELNTAPGSPIEFCQVGSDACESVYVGTDGVFQRTLSSSAEHDIAVFPGEGSSEAVNRVRIPSLPIGSTWRGTLNPRPELGLLPHYVTLNGMARDDWGGAVPQIPADQAVEIVVTGLCGRADGIFEIRDAADDVVATGSMAFEDGEVNVHRGEVDAQDLSPGEYRAGVQGPGCNLVFDFFLVPVVRVSDADDAPIEGAEVTLLRADTADGEYLALESDTGDHLLPAFRANPVYSDTEGQAGFLMRMGHYRASATAEACHSPSDPEVAEVESDAFMVNLNRRAPAVIELTMVCPVPEEPEQPEPPQEPDPVPAIPAAPIVSNEEPPNLAPELSARPRLALRVQSRCLAPRVPQRRRPSVQVPLRAMLNVSQAARLRILVERRTIAPARLRCPAAANPPVRISKYRRFGRITRQVDAGRYRLLLPVQDRQTARASSAVRSLRLPVQKLRRGTYRLTITATNASGQSQRVQSHFIVLAARPGAGSGQW